MDLIWEKFTEWLKELLVGGIMDNLTGLFDNVNAKVAEAAGHIGSTPQAWNANIYSMIRSLSDNLILPIAGDPRLRHDAGADTAYRGPQ